jgi:DNA-binding CsgD family transcriptional regulator
VTFPLTQVRRPARAAEPFPGEHGARTLRPAGVPARPAGVPARLPGPPPARPAGRRAAPVLVGRRPELAGLAALAADAIAGVPRVALIEGDAGTGKSALAAELLSRHRGVPVLAASGDPGEHGLAFGLVRQLISQIDGESLACCPVLAGGPDPGADPLAAGAELLQLFAGRSAVSGLIILVEDVQWADLRSLRALLFACRRLAAHRVLVVLSARPHGLRRLGEGWARFLACDHTCTRMVLTGLDRAELAQLAAALGRGSLSGRALRRIADYSRGNPLFARALLAEVPERVLEGPDAGLSVPRSISAAILPRLAALPAAARNLVSAASVLGGQCRVADAAALAGVARPDSALDAAVAAGLVMTGPDHRGMSFADELTRRVVYADIGTARRRSLHKWAASVAEGPDALAHSVAAAAGSDPQLAALLDAAAAAATAQGEVSQAALQLTQAADLGARGPARAGRLLSAAELLIGTADAAAAGPLRSLVQQLPSSARRDAVLGHLAMLRARTREAEAMYLATWQAHQPGAAGAGPDSSAGDAAAARGPAASAAAGLAVLYGNARQLPECRRWTARSIRAAAGPGAGAGTGAEHIRCLQALARALSGDAVTALRSFAGLPEPAALVPDSQADALTIRGVLRLWTGDLAGADDDLSAAAGLLHGGLRLCFPGHALGYLAQAEFQLGRWDDAQSHAELAVSLAEEAGRASDLPLAHSLAAQVAALRGEWELASAHVRAAEQAARVAGNLAAVVLAATARSVLGFARDDPAEVLQATARIAAMPGAGGYDDPAAYLWQPMRVWALLRTGQASAAGLAVEDCAAQRAGQIALVDCARLRAAIALSRNEPARAEQLLEQASSIANRLPVPLARALFDIERARCLARLHKRPAALARLRSAHEALAALRATPLADAAQAELAALGLRDRPGADGSLPGLTGLTPQEMQVATLVAAGLSNRETAARLYLSPKTIEYHLAHIFAKLGIRTRYQLAARFRAARGAPAEREPARLEREPGRLAVSAGNQPGEGRDSDLCRSP